MLKRRMIIIGLSIGLAALLGGITGVRLVAANRHVVLPAAKEGKQKTVSQMLTIAVILVVLVIQELPVSHALSLPPLTCRESTGECQALRHLSGGRS